MIVVAAEHPPTPMPPQVRAVVVGRRRTCIIRRYVSLLFRFNYTDCGWRAAAGSPQFYHQPHDGICSLPELSSATTLNYMRESIRHLLLVLCALAFFSGTTIGFASHLAAAGEPCAEHHVDGKADHHHDRSGSCLTCCVGACVAIPDLPPHPLSSLTPLTATTVAYWGSGVIISGRSITPDPIPPRLST